MRWQCEYRNAKGIRCEAKALRRIQFSYDHPFDFMDLCEEHLREYPVFAWSHTLEEEPNDNTRAGE